MERAKRTSKPMDEQSPALEELGFDRVLQRLRAVVEQLETGQLSLEDSLRVYEEGVALARRGHHVLDSAEKRVELLVRDSARNGESTAVPFDEEDGSESDGRGGQE